MLSSRERVEAALNHREGDRVPLDLGATNCSGIHVSSLYALRQAFGLDSPGTPVKVSEPFQMLGEVTPNLLDCLGIDAIRVGLPTNVYGFRNEDWKPWTTFDGTPVLVPGKFPTEPEAKWGSAHLSRGRPLGTTLRRAHARHRVLFRLDHAPGTARGC